MGIVRDNVMDLKVYIPGKPIEAVQRELGLERVVKLASNENPLGPSPKAMSAMEKALNDIKLYPDGSAHYLKEALAEHWGVNQTQLFLGNGSDEIIAFLALAFINSGDEAIMANPSFPRYEPVVKMMNGVPIEVPLTEDFRHDLKAMAQAISDRTKLIFICNPNNPTGTIVSKSEVDEFMAQVPDHAVVIFDEAYFEYVAKADYPNGLDYLAQGKKVIVLRTFSKAYGLAGLRVGYAITEPDLVIALEKVRPPFNVNLVGQAGAFASLQDEEYLRYSIAENNKGLQYLYSEFDRLNLPYVVSHTNFVLFNCLKDANEVFQSLLKKGVIVRALGLQSWIRVTVGTQEENEIFIKALEEVL